MITLKEYAEAIAKLAKTYPDIQVVASSDDEGNSFNPVHFGPTLGHYASVEEFIPAKDAKKEGLPINAVCIN